MIQGYSRYPGGALVQNAEHIETADGHARYRRSGVSLTPRERTETPRCRRNRGRWPPRLRRGMVRRTGLALTPGVRHGARHPDRRSIGPAHSPIAAWPEASAGCRDRQCPVCRRRSRVSFRAREHSETWRWRTSGPRNVRHQVGDFRPIAMAGNDRNQRADRAKPLAGTCQKQNSAAGTDLAAAERGRGPNSIKRPEPRELILCPARSIHHPTFGPHCVSLRRKHFNTEKKPRATEKAEWRVARSACRLRTMGYARQTLLLICRLQPPLPSCGPRLLLRVKLFLADVIRSGAVNCRHRGSDISCTQHYPFETVFQYHYFTQ